jgi:hypothetical protein
MEINSFTPVPIANDRFSQGLQQTNLFSEFHKLVGDVARPRVKISPVAVNGDALT